MRSAIVSIVDFAADLSPVYSCIRARFCSNSTTPASVFPNNVSLMLIASCTCTFAASKSDRSISILIRSLKMASCSSFCAALRLLILSARSQDCFAKSTLPLTSCVVDRLSSGPIKSSLNSVPSCSLILMAPLNALQRHSASPPVQELLRMY